jgi:DMSO/TMAO reductase YedYZ molybdopterin-dependent catalytic subunit
MAMDRSGGGACFVSRRVFVRRLAAGAALLRLSACEISSRMATAPDAAGSSTSAPGKCLPFLTPLDTFYRQFGGRSTVEGWSMPELDPEAFELRIDGLVSSELSVKLAELEADTEHHVTVVKTMICVLGYRSTALFTGIPLRLLLDRAGIDRDHAVRVRFFGADGFENNLRVSDIYDGPADLFEPLIAFRIYGEPLPRELGFPFRLLLGDRYGYKNTKWLARITVSDRDEPTGQYQAEGYPDDGLIEPIATVENLRIEEKLAAGPVELCGFALSGSAAIERVELALDQGPFMPSTLASLVELTHEFPELEQSLQLGDPSRFGFPMRGVWVAWRMRIDLRPGEHRVRIRVRDTAGNVADGTDLHLSARA